MNAARLEDRIRWGANVAARTIGVLTDAYRPRAAEEPLSPANRFLRLHAAFCNANGGFARTAAYGNALWHGVFDAAYTRPGDYLVQPEGTWFIACQSSLSPVLCIHTDRVVSISRPSPQPSTGVNSYGGITASNTIPLMINWPASVLGASGGGHSSGNLPGDNTVPSWTVLLPYSEGVLLRPADLMSDDLGRHAVVTAAELTGLGWRMAVKQVTT